MGRPHVPQPRLRLRCCHDGDGACACVNTQRTHDSKPSRGRAASRAGTSGSGPHGKAIGRCLVTTKQHCPRQGQAPKVHPAREGSKPACHQAACWAFWFDSLPAIRVLACQTLPTASREASSSTKRYGLATRTSHPSVVGPGHIEPQTWGWVGRGWAGNRAFPQSEP